MKFQKKWPLIVIVLSLLILTLVLFTQIKSKKEITLSDIDAIVAPYFESGDFSGTIYMKHNGKEIGQKNYGYADIDSSQAIENNTVFRVGSISKQFTAAGILLLEQEGKLKTTDLLSDYIKGFPGETEITLHHLLSHGSGIFDINETQNYSDLMIRGAGLDEELDRIKDRPVSFKPGKKYRYSNSNYLLLAKVIEQVTGKSYTEFMEKSVFLPSNMKDTKVVNTSDEISNMAIGYTPGAVGYKITPYENLEVKTGAGNIVSTAKDMLQWHEVLRTEDLLSDQSKKKFFSKQNDDYGYGWTIVEIPFITHMATHDGRVPGYRSMFVHGIKNDLCLIILANKETNAMVAIRDRVRSLMRKGKYDPLFLPKYADKLPENPKDFVGIYQDDLGESFRIVEEDGGIAFQWPYDHYSQFLQKAPETDLFIMRNRGNYCQFKRDDNGDVSGMSMGSWVVKKIK